MSWWNTSGGAAFGRTPWGNPVQCSQALPPGPFAKPSHKQLQTARKRLQTGSGARKRTQTTRKSAKRVQTPAKDCRQHINGRKRLEAAPSGTFAKKANENTQSLHLPRECLGSLGQRAQLPDYSAARTPCHGTLQRARVVSFGVKMQYA